MSKPLRSYRFGRTSCATHVYTFTLVALILTACNAVAQTRLPLRERAAQYLDDLIRLDTSNPPATKRVLPNT